MSMPREFHEVLSQVDFLCSRLRETSLSGNLRDFTSVHELLEMMAPILSNPLRYVFPSVDMYSDACDRMFSQFSNMLIDFDYILNHPEWYAHLGCSIKWPVSLECRKPSQSEDAGPYKPLILELEIMNFPNRDLANINFRGRGLTTLINLRTPGGMEGHAVDLLEVVFISFHDLEKRMMRKMNCRMEYVSAVNAGDITLNSWGGPQTRDHEDMEMNIRDEMKTHVVSTSLIPAFDVVSLEREANEFRIRASLMSTVGQHAADHVRFIPGNSGYHEAAHDFTQFQP